MGEVLREEDEREKGEERVKKNLLTADFSTLVLQLCISSNMAQKTKLCSWE